MEHYVYVLIDPRTNLKMYAGKTANPAARRACHEDPETYTNAKMKIWKQKLAAVGLRPVFRVVEVCDERTVDLVESRWIRRLWETNPLSLNQIDNCEAGKAARLLTEQGRRKAEAKRRKQEKANKEAKERAAFEHRKAILDDYYSAEEKPTHRKAMVFSPPRRKSRRRFAHRNATEYPETKNQLMTRTSKQVATDGKTVRRSNVYRNFDDLG